MTAMNMAALSAIINGATSATTCEVLEAGQQAAVEAMRKSNWEVEMKRKAARQELVQLEKELGLRADSVSVKAVPQAVYSRK